MPTWNDYVNGARAAARKQAFERAKATIARTRQKEKLLRARGLGTPFSDLIASDLERMAKTGAFAALQGTPEFDARVRLLRDEGAQAVQDIKESEDHAVILATLSPPPEMAMVRRHEGERQRFLTQNGVKDPRKAPSAVKADYLALLARQKMEADEFNT
jgi:hypothetical protein